MLYILYVYHIKGTVSIQKHVLQPAGVQKKHLPSHVSITISNVPFNIELQNNLYLVVVICT